ncbi:tRNA pseudouridine(55) synthase TruB [Chryseomicrobium sp. FSL W7-1435]|uniref:tRNA pseudouridine(55) synthase TruB n=1 Tax=Chryseomicrobium sp. FSL W7-1435 TaxID=2921704 RepID=UPI0031599FF0
MQQLEGILPLWKEAGMTSHDCVFKLRKILKMKRIGHTGTLDPDVEGVLPICLGQATKVAEYVMAQGKAYRATVSLGKATTTEDASGDVIASVDNPIHLESIQLQDTLTQLTGTITQTPPMYSAVKVNGRRLYEYAREGKVIDRPSREVTIHSLTLVKEPSVWTGEEIDFEIEVVCSKGTYIRTLAVQIGKLLGVPAHMKKLIRTQAGGFGVAETRTIQQVAELYEEQRMDELLQPIERSLTEWPFHEIPADLEKAFSNGQVLPAHTDLLIHDKIVIGKNGVAHAVYRAHPEKPGYMKPEKMFTRPEMEIQ